MRTVAFALALAAIFVPGCIVVAEKPLDDGSAPPRPPPPPPPPPAEHGWVEAAVLLKYTKSVEEVYNCAKQILQDRNFSITAHDRSGDDWWLHAALGGDHRVDILFDRHSHKTRTTVTYKRHANISTVALARLARGIHDEIGRRLGEKGQD